MPVADLPLARAGVLSRILPVVVSFLFAPNGQIDGWCVTMVTPEQVLPEGQSEKLAFPLHVSRR